MLKVGGFPEYLPWQQDIVDGVTETIRTNFSQFRYQHIHTPAVERTEVLTAKGGQEASKQIYGLYGLAQGAQDTKEYGLHFDLTIPFARYILDYEHHLTFPFKRRQMQPVWRGERQQKGRFKEFVQADIDTIWQGDIGREYLYYDAETVMVLYKSCTDILQYLDISTGVTIRISNKKVILGLIESLDPSNQAEILARLDSYYKMSHDAFIEGLQECIPNTTIVDQIVNLLEVLNTDIDKAASLSTNDLFQEGIRELQLLANHLDLLSAALQIPVTYHLDAAIVRGLDYYTGTVFETFLDEYTDYGSICSGGRYEHLTTALDEKREFSGVGGSIGIDRFMSWVFDSGLVTKESLIATQTGDSSSYLLLHFPETFSATVKLAGKLLKEGASVSIYPEPDKLKKQFSYADKSGFTHVIVLGDEEQKKGVYRCKTMSTGDEEEVVI